MVLFKAFNSIFGKIGRSASEEVIFELIKSKCLPVLIYPSNSLIQLIGILYSF